MRSNRIRPAAWFLTAAALLTVTIPAFAGSVNGTITLKTPTSKSALHGIIPVRWDFRRGDYISSKSQVNLAVSVNGTSWQSITTNIPIRLGGVSIDTSVFPDYAYAVRVSIAGHPSIRSVAGPLYFDNTAPSVRITRPQQGDFMFEDEPLVQTAVVIGTATLEAATSDNLTGIRSTSWWLDGSQIGIGNPFTYNFSAAPGSHTLTALAIDGAGNMAQHAISVFVVPGPSAADPNNVPSLLPTPGTGSTGPQPSGSSSPGPNPTGLPTTLPTGLPTTLPTELPTQLPTGLPTELPTGLPTELPTSLPSDPATLLPTLSPSALPSLPLPLPSLGL